MLLYITCLLNSNAYETTEKTIRNYLKKKWDENLARTYGLIQDVDASKQLEHAEHWLRDHGRSPMLLLTLGRLCNRLQLWGKARVYYESSIAMQPSTEAHAELAELLETLGEKDSAYESYRKGLSLAVSDSKDDQASDPVKLTPEVSSPTKDQEKISNRSIPKIHSIASTKSL